MTQQRGRKSTAQLVIQDQRNAEDYAAKIENARTGRAPRYGAGLRRGGANRVIRPRG
jgi:hypothetical protein